MTVRSAARRPLTKRIRWRVLGLVWALGLTVLAIAVPPDGQVRGDLAQFLGGFHPLVIHLPITLLLLVPVLELAGRNARRKCLGDTAGFVLALAAISALLAPSLGWLLAWSGGFGGALVTQHLWGGIAVATGSVVCWMMRTDSSASLADADSRPSALYAGTLALTLAVMVWTGYRGGQLAHGENHLTEHLPPALQTWLGVSSARKASAVGTASTFYAARIAPIFEQHCLICHGDSKRKGGLRLDSYEHLMHGGDDGVVIKPGHASASDLFRRVSLEPSHEDVMPADGKPPLGEDERRLLQVWIDAGASATLGVDAIAGVASMPAPAEPLTPDYRTDEPTLVRLQDTLGIRLVPRSKNPTDGLILRTASAPERCDDAAIAALAPVGRYIVDAELARTRITDAGLRSLNAFPNLRTLDLSHTAVSTTGVRELAALKRLEALNLTATTVDPASLNLLQQQHPTLKHLHAFQTGTTPEPPGRAGSVP